MFGLIAFIVFGILYCFIKLNILDILRTLLFVIDTCYDRDSTHGYIHAIQVATKAILFYILDVLNLRIRSSVNVFTNIIIVGLLHDIDDKKYDGDGQLTNKLNTFLDKLMTKQKKEWIINIIHRISYSKEKQMMLQYGKLDWDIVLEKDGIIIRNYVSDADKLYSLGKNGLHICIDYTKHMFKEKHSSYTDDQILDNVDRHIKEKLGTMYSDGFFKTYYGKYYAQKYTIELLDEFDKWKLSYHSNE